jgi:hypothetical protein
MTFATFLVFEEVHFITCNSVEHRELGMNPWRTCVLLVVLFMSFLWMARGEAQQTGSPGEAAAIVGRSAAKAIANAGHLHDSLSAVTANAYRNGIRRFASFGDSLQMASADSLDRPRRDSLRLFFGDASRKLAHLNESSLDYLKALRDVHARELAALRDTVLERLRKPVADRRNLDPQVFVEIADSLSYDFRDTVVAATEDATGDIMDAIVESIEDARDYARDLLDDRADEIADSIAAEKENASHFMLETSYTTRETYLGRDGGVAQQAFSPSVAYYHRSGFNLTLGVTNLPGGAAGWDQASFAAGYDFDIGEVLTGAMSYSHYWFRSNSKLPRSVLDQNIGASLLASLPHLVLGLSAGLDFGNKSEFNAGLLGSVPFRLTREAAKVEVSLDPEAAVSWGQQNSEVVARRRQKVKGQQILRTVRTSSSVFSVMSYELSLPLSVTSGGFSVQPSVDYTLPANVLDGSTSDPYAGFSLVVSLRLP